jgi:hypothetical protein
MASVVQKKQTQVRKKIKVSNVLQELAQTLEQRKTADPKQSYVAS